jgi:hypothetical protein
MREEEKVRREQERAIKEAQDKEEAIKLALEKARMEAEHANAQEQAKHDAQIAELTKRLAEAEAVKQREISMAQLTRAGNVYIISNIGSFGEDVFKIGMTRRREPMERIWELGDASVRFEFDVHAMIFSEDAPALESLLHAEFENMRINKVNDRKEFFRVSLQGIRDVVAAKGLAASFTMVAEWSACSILNPGLDTDTKAFRLEVVELRGSHRTPPVTRAMRPWRLKRTIVAGHCSVGNT